MRPIRWDGFGRDALVGDAHGGTARGWEGLEEGTGGLSHEPLLLWPHTPIFLFNSMEMGMIVCE